MKEQKIIKSGGHCYDGTGYPECSFWNMKKSKCMLFGKNGIHKNASKSLQICNKIYGNEYDGEV